tara:strand:- start:203 stop:334 length:132 start_codon:yes stop_codon:yes gene_type:complete
MVTHPTTKPLSDEEEENLKKKEGECVKEKESKEIVELDDVILL